uniref:Tower domain-containing protein n=1 Tax=Callorhinchus milii TaxID=7868 RepID=A0A4W3K637_CALMI
MLVTLFKKLVRKLTNIVHPLICLQLIIDDIIWEHLVFVSGIKCNNSNKLQSYRVFTSGRRPEMLDSLYRAGGLDQGVWREGWSRRVTKGMVEEEGLKTGFEGHLKTFFKNFFKKLHDLYLYSTQVTPKRISESLGAKFDSDMSWSSSLATPPSLSPTHYGFCNTESKFNGFKTASEKHIKISAENLSKGKLLFKEIENMILEVINTQDTTIEHIPAQNRDTIQETESTNSSDETENKINFKVPVGVIHKSLPHVIINTQTNNTSAVISEPKLFGQDACLTASQTADVAELFSMLEDTGSQTEFTQFRKKSPIDSPSLTPIWSEWKDVDFDENFEIESSLPLNSKPCISQQRAGNRVLTEISKCLKVIKNRSESNQQIAEKIKQIKSNDCGDSFDSSNKTKPCTASLIPNSCMSDLEIDSNTDKKELVTKLNLAVLPPKMNAACTNIHGGFCTANGSKIKLSSESLKKSADIFREIDHDQGQTSSETISNRHLGYLHDSSTMENEKVAEDKLGDVTKILTSKTYHECPGNVKAALNVPICAVSATASMNSISVDSGIFIKESQVSGKKELPSPVEQVHLPDVTDTEMRGFQTASGKIVSICRASLTKAKTFFAEEDLPMNAPETFSTAVPAPHVDAQFIDNTVKNTATEQEPDKSKISGSLSSCIKQDDFAITGKVCEDPTAEPRFQVLTGYPIGFSTASGKSLQVSEELLRKCKQLFSEIEGNKDDFEKILEKDLKPELAKTKSSGENFSLDTNVSFGFNTASGKKVIVSNGAQQKAKSMLKEFDDMNDGPLGSLEYPKGKIYEKTQELVSPEANCSDRVSAVCDDFHGEANGSIINNAELNTGPSKPLSASELNSKICMLGFETAKRKEVIVEESNISVARSFLASKEERTADLTTGEKDGVASAVTFSWFFSFLIVATGESTSVDSGAMMKVRQVFDNEELLSANCYPIQQEPQLDDSVTGMKGFQTASGKIVSVCKVSLAKAKAFFAEADLSMNVPETFSTTVPPPYIGTQFIDDTIKNTTTDQNNEPDKSKISGSFSNHLNLTKQDDFAITSKVWEGTASEPPCQALTEHIGFSTASGKSVQVSEESLRECKKLFSEIEDTASTNISFGFNTASGKRVPVSNDALQKAKFKLKEFDDMNDGSLGSLEYPEGKIYEKTRALVSESSLSTADDPSLNGHPTCTKRSTINPGLSKPLPANGLNSKICMFGFQTAHGKDVLVEESNLAAARSFLASEKESTAGENVGVAGDRSSNCNADSVSVLRSHALKNDLDAHSKILENYIENEMLESAKALLEDDPFDSTSDYGVQSNVESMNQSDRSKLRMGKRLRSEEKLAKGIFCDRRKFTYNVPLKPLICDPSKGSVQMVHNLQCARDLQEMRLIKKRRQTIRPEPGSLYRTKHSGAARKSLHTAVEGMFPVSRRGGKVQMTFCANAESFCINCREFFSEELMMAGNGIQLADGEWLIPDHSGMAGKSAFHRALLDTPGVDPKLITEAWTYNHYKWIVWKLAAMETAFPKQFGSRCLTPEMLLLQLKYRYDVEIDKSRRSALRKIMERDDTSTKTLILCVSKIISMANDLPVGVIEVTDGWYGIKVILDRPLTALLQKKRLAVGQKIVVHGAELIGSQDAYTPLEAPESLMMKISANSTRRARWYAKLGFHYDPRPFPLPLSSLFGEGGMVGCVDVIIQRTYPIQWMEKKCNGVCVFRNERAEEREAQIHCEKEQRKLEALCAKIEADLQEKYKKHRMQRLNKQQIMKLQEGVELYEAIQNSLDPSSLEVTEYPLCLFITVQNYIQSFVEFRKALESAQSDSGYPKRDVSPVWKLRIVDYKGQDNNAVYMLSIWRPVAELQSLLKEGKRYRIYHLNTSCCKSRFGGVDLQLTATKKTRYQQFQPSPEVLEKLYHPRQAVVYNMLYNPSFRTFCKEIDLVGYVIYITEKAGFAPMVYLANENQDLVVVKFWASLNQLVLEDTVKLGALIIASNLQWSSDSYMNVPKLFAGELSSFSANPKEALLRETYNELKSSVQFPKIFLKDAEEKVMALLKTINTPTSLRSSRDFGIDLRTPHTPIQRTPKFIPAKSSTEVYSLSNLKKKGLSFLSRVPSPPRLSPLYNSVPQSVQKGFRPPRICITPQSSTKVKSKESSNVQTPSLSRAAISKMTEVNWIPDEELAMINTQDLCDNLVDNEINRQKIKREQTVNCKVPAVLLQNVKNDFHSDIELQNSSAAIESTNHLVASQSKRKCTEGTITLNTCEGVYQSEENVITQNHEYGGDEVQHQPGKLLLCRKKPQQRWKRKRY